MASDWMLQELQSSGIKPTNQAAAQPVQQPALAHPSAPAPTVQPKVAISQPKQTQPVHGKLFSGNLVSKAMDVMQLPYYGLAGYTEGAFNKAKQIGIDAKRTGNLNPSSVLGDINKAGLNKIIPAIQTRKQFGREQGDYNLGSNVTDNALGQEAINFTASLGAPSLPLGKVLSPLGKIASKVPGVSKAVEEVGNVGGKVLNAVKKNEGLATQLEKVPGLTYLRNPEAGKIIEQGKHAADTRISSLYNTINDAAKGLTPAEREQVGQLIEGKLQNANTKLAQRANYIKGISDQIGKEMVDQGLMSPESFAAFKGKYMSHIADTVRTEEMAKNVGNKPVQFLTSSLKQRKNILGNGSAPDYIRQFQFPTFKALGSEIKTVESTKAVKQLAEQMGKTVDTSTLIKNGGNAARTTADGMVHLQDLLPGKIGKQFKGVVVPKEVGDYLTRSFKSTAPDIFDKAINAWKLGKTVYSGPGYHVRNIGSNIILSDWQTGAGLPVTAGNYVNATETLLGKGSATMNKYLQEMKDAGVIGRTGLSQGIESLHPNTFGQGESLAKKIVSAPSNFQGAAEDAAKLNVYSLLRDKGHSVEDAAKMAEEAIFSPHRISQAERGAVRKIIPFYSFARQALPFTVKTALQHPDRITKYAKAKTAVESMSPNDTGNNANLPANLEGQVRLPVKDKQGNNAYADPTFVYPFGNFGDMGGASKLPFGLSVNPVAQEVAQQAFNKDLYFGQPIAKSQIPARANAQRVQHAFQTFAPNIMPTDFAGGIPTGQPGLNLSTRGGDKLYSAFTGKKDYAGRTRSKTQAVADTFGLKSAFYDAPTQQKFDAIGKVKQMKDIRTEMKNVMQNKSFDSKTKREYIKQLNQQLLDVIHN